MTKTEEQKNISGMIIDPVARRIFPGHIYWADGISSSIAEDSNIEESHFIFPPPH